MIIRKIVYGELSINQDNDKKPMHIYFLPKNKYIGK